MYMRNVRHDDLEEEEEEESSFCTLRTGRKHCFCDGKCLMGGFKVERELGSSQGRIIKDNRTLYAS